MQCTIYKSRTKQDYFLYVTVKDDFSRVPEALLRILGEPVHVMDLELTQDRKLAQEDITLVLQSLREQGWYLQMPRKGEILGLH